MSFFDFQFLHLLPLGAVAGSLLRRNEPLSQAFSVAPRPRAILDQSEHSFDCAFSAPPKSPKIDTRYLLKPRTQKRVTIKPKV